MRLRQLSNKNKTALLSVLHLISIQSVVLFLIAFLWSLSSPKEMLYVLLGGYVFVIPNVFFAYHFFKMRREGRSPRETVIKFYKYKLIKFTLLIGLVIFIFSELPVLIFPFLSGLLGACLSVFFIPLFLGLKRNSKAKAFIV